MTKSALAALALASAVVALPAAAQETTSTGAVAATAAELPPLTTKSGTIGAPPAGKAQVVFWRPGSIVGVAMGCTVVEGAAEVEVARLGSGKYWVHVAEPGPHQYYTAGEATDRLDVELRAGQTYFVKCSIGMGIMSGHGQVSLTDRSAFAKKAKGMKLWEPDTQD